MGYDPQSWQNFYIVTGSAAGALVGLLFVGLSLHARAIVHHPILGTRAVGALSSLLTQLLLSVAVLVPGQSLGALGFEVSVAALLMFGVTIRSVRSVRRHSLLPSHSTLRRTTETTGALIWMALFLASGPSLMLHAGGGLYLLAGTMLFMLAWNVYVAWTLVTEVSD